MVDGEFWGMAKRVILALDLGYTDEEVAELFLLDEDLLINGDKWRRK